jgi:hypothetical protein
MQPRRDVHGIISLVGRGHLVPNGSTRCSYTMRSAALGRNLSVVTSKRIPWYDVVAANPDNAQRQASRACSPL